MEKMKIGVISDIHSNYLAFRAVYDIMRSQGITEYILLGDYVSDTSDTEKTMELLYEIIRDRKTHILRGNREEYLLEQRKVRKGDKEGPRWIANSASGNLLFTFERLREKDFQFFESLPITFKFEKEGFPAITCCHGSPANTKELLQLNGENTKNWLCQIDTEYLLAAHTHFPGEFRYEGKTYINNGCAGLAIGDAGLAQCTILHGTEENGVRKWEPEFLKIPYDTEAVVGKIFTSGLMDMAPWFINSNIQILRTGTDNSAQLVALSARLMEEETGSKVIWPFIDEKYFERAAEILGVPDYRESQ